ncbi:MAG: hypothetical protein GY859_05945, partial [Desulfobacterales bacterium]|nr:hypothetical protein [Desulfobacterales bacterium]
MDKRTEYQQIINTWGYKTNYHYLEEALSRNIGIFSLPEQDRLIHSTVAIPGLGGVGGQYLVTLARSGVGSFHVSDFDTFEPANLNRQYGARVSDFGRSKRDAMVAEALNINPYLKIRRFDAVSPENIHEFLDGVDVVADGMDFFNFKIRKLIFNESCNKGIHVVTAGPLGFSSALLVFAPDKGMTFDAYFNLSDSMSEEDKLIAFLVGLAPRATQMAYIIPGSFDMENHKGPSTGAGIQMCAAAAISEIIRILLGKKGVKPAPHYFQYDPYARKFYQGYMPFGNKNPLQRLKLALTKRMLRKPKQSAAPEVVKPPLDFFDKETIPDELLNYLLWAG